MHQSQNLYSILNVSPDADSVVIEAAYKALMKKYHPDRMEPGAANLRKAAMINEAFTILKDPRKRADYNLRQLPPERVLMAPNPRDIAPPPRLKAVAWSGWVAAAAFGVALAVTINTRDTRVQPVALQPQLAASEAEAVRKIEVAAANEALRNIEAAAAEEPLNFGASAAVAAPLVGSAAVAAALDEPPTTTPQPRRRVAKYVAKKRPLRPRAPARTGGAREKDFLEREGYIY